MAKYKLTNKAVDDLTRIWNYACHKWNESQADIYYKILLDSFKELAQKPEIGKNYLKIAGGLIGFKSGKHIIFYRKVNDQEIEVIRILHERMDLKKRVQE